MEPEGSSSCSQNHSLITSLGQVNPLNILTHYLFKIQFNIILPSTRRFCSQVSFLQVLSTTDLYGFLTSSTRATWPETPSTVYNQNARNGSEDDVSGHEQTWSLIYALVYAINAKNTWQVNNNRSFCRYIEHTLASSRIYECVMVHLLNYWLACCTLQCSWMPTWLLFSQHTVNLNTMEQSTSWEIASCAATQEYPNILWNSNVYCRVHRACHKSLSKARKSSCKNERVVLAKTNVFIHRFTTCFGLERPSWDVSWGNTQMVMEYI
jgi:hypothetical protein